MKLGVQGVAIRSTCGVHSICFSKSWKQRGVRLHSVGIALSLERASADTLRLPCRYTARSFFMTEFRNLFDNAWIDEELFEPLFLMTK